MTVDAALVASYQHHLNQTGVALGAVAVRHWSELGTWNKADISRFAEQLAPAATAATDHAMSLAKGFIALASGFDIADVAFDPEEVDWAPAFQTTWKALADGLDFDAALQIGENTVDSLGYDAVQSAARSATKQIDQNDERFTRWAREPDGAACDWCLLVAEQTYLSADSADFGHDHCGCSVVPA